jgi:mediator of RNA polymerase II transcription subunit 6
VADKVKTEIKKEVPKKEEPSSLFQRQRVDMLLADLLRNFPPTTLQTQPTGATTASENNKKAEGSTNIKTETPVDNNIKSEQTQSEALSQSDSLGQDKDVKSEMKPPPEKKMKL